MKLTAYILLFLFVAKIQAQEVKQEFEQRINAKDMPKGSFTYLETLKIKKGHLRHYKEQDGTLTSYESKFKAKGKRYSVEFNQDGTLLDIEIEIEKKHMGAALEQVENYLNTHFERFRIEKVQAQHEPEADFNPQSPGNPDAWELIVATKNASNTLARFEMTFNPAGKFLKSRKVVRQSYEFLLF